MKNLMLLSLIFVLYTYNLKAQNVVSKAFSASYAYEANSEYSKAVSALQGVYNKDSYSINLRLGWLYYLSKDYLKSEAYYVKAVNLKTKSIEARLGLAYPLVATKNWSKAIKNYQSMLYISPYNSVVNYRLAYIYFYQIKDTQKALKHIQKALEIYPFDFDSNYLLSLIQIKLGNIIEAKKAIEIALQNKPNSTDAKAVYESLN